MVVCPPFTALRSVQTTIDGDRLQIQLGAQNCHWETEGAYTGEISPLMLAKLNVKYVIVGHSERREIFGETDEIVVEEAARRARGGHDADPLRRGDARGARGRATTDAKVKGQIEAAFARLPIDDAARCIVAYEPIWAIGTGRSASPDDANATIGVIREHVRVGLGDVLADGLRILYGGSMKPGNVAELMADARDRRRPGRRRLPRPRRLRPHRPVLRTRESEPGSESVDQETLGAAQRGDHRIAPDRLRWS